jgi:hypothetical protein
MKRLHTGVILLDGIDILCISFCAGSIIAYGYRKYKDYRIIRGEDPIVGELKKKSPIQMFSEKGKPLKLPLVRGGYLTKRIRGYSLMIKSKRLSKILMAIVHAKRSQRKLKLLQDFFMIMNGILTASTGFRIAAGGSLNYVQILLIAFPSTIGGFLLGTISECPVASALLPIAILFGRGIEDVPDPYEKCRLLCKVAEEYHTKQLMVEMKNFRSIVEDASDALQLPLDQVPLLCTENKISLTQRFRLKEVIRSAKARKRVQHFSEFIKKFPECDADPETVFQEIMETGQRIPVKNG